MSASSTTTAGLRPVAEALGRVLDEAGHAELAPLVAAAAARADRPATIVCVVGEFKQGKSSLVNGLLGRPVCPVDDDLATSAITLVRHGARPQVVVRHGDGRGGRSTTTTDLAGVADWATECGNPDNARSVDRVEISLPSPLLEQGLVVVDTPGMGGLGAGHAAATLAFLPFADALLLVSDASSELTATELDLLTRATERCPTVMFVQTKVDLYPEWQRIHELNLGHLGRRGIDIPAAAVSSTLRQLALERRDRDLNERSGFPRLLAVLGDEVVGPAKDGARARATAELRAVTGAVRDTLARERAIVADPGSLSAAQAELDRTTAHLEHLRGPAARWSVVLSDRVADLSTSVQHQLRTSLRAIGRAMDERIETLARPDDWDRSARDLQTGVAECVARAVAAIESERTALRADLAELLADEDLARGGDAAASRSIDVASLWQAADLRTPGGARAALGTTVTGLRGAQGGVMMLGMLGNFLPRAAATVVVANPVLLGAGLVFGGMGVLDDRRRRVTQMRQTARQQVRQYLDDVQLEVGNELTTLVRDLQRQLRDELTDQLATRQRLADDAVRRAREALGRDQRRREQRLGQLGGWLDALERIEATLVPAEDR